jgi:hypothetical protein
MLQFFVFALSGFWGTWLILFFWGFTAGPANAAPYFGLIGDLLLLLVAAPTALFVPRIAACLGSVGAACTLLLPLFFRVPGMDLSGALLGYGPPLLVVVIAALTLWRMRLQGWFVFARWPHLALRVPIALVPLVGFPFCFNAPLVFQLLLAGPPR